MAKFNLTLKPVFAKRQTYIDMISSSTSFSEQSAADIFDYLASSGYFRKFTKGEKTPRGKRYKFTAYFPEGTRVGGDPKTITFDDIGVSEATKTAGHSIYWTGKDYVTINPNNNRISSVSDNLEIQIGASRTTKGNENVLVEARGSLIIEGGGSDTVESNQTETQTKLYDFIEYHDNSNNVKMSSNLVDEIEKTGRRLIPTDKLPRNFEGQIEFKDPGNKKVKRKYKYQNET